MLRKEKGAKWKTSRMAQDVRFKCRRAGSSRDSKGMFKCRKTSLRRNEPIRSRDYLLLNQHNLVEVEVKQRQNEPRLFHLYEIDITEHTYLSLGSSAFDLTVHKLTLQMATFFCVGMISEWRNPF